MTATQVELPKLPDELELAEFTLVLNIEPLFFEDGDSQQEGHP